MRLIEIVTSTDWKGRPSQKIETIAESDSSISLQVACDAAIKKWQEEDVQADLECDPDASILWDVDGERWEMSERDSLSRQFVYKLGVGGFCSICYHVLD
jgi:hypothetical protein